MPDKNSNTLSLREQILVIIESEGISQNQISREIGISGAALSGFLNANYSGDNQALEKKMEQWLSLRRRKAKKAKCLPPPPDFVPTPTSKKIIAVLEYGHAAGDIVAIYGSSGVSKTKTIEHYRQENPNVWVATMTPAHSGVSACLEEIAHALEMRGLSARASRLFREIEPRVRGTLGLIIIDEAQHLQPTALEVIRALHDASGIGIVLAGNETVYARLTGGVKSAIFAQLFSRVGKRLKIVRPLKADVVSIANALGVTGKKECDALYSIAQKPGALRSVVKTLRLAFLLASGAETSVDEQVIWSAWNDLAGENL